MNKLNYEILSAIDNIDSTIMESEMNVMNSLIASYDKAVMILECCNDNSDVSSYDIFQESIGHAVGTAIDKLDDKMKAKPNENIIKKILLFIPRAVMKLIQTLRTKYNEKKLDKAAKDLSNIIDEIDEVIDLDGVFDVDDDESDDNKSDVQQEAFTLPFTKTKTKQQENPTGISNTGVVGSERDKRKNLINDIENVGYAFKNKDPNAKSKLKNMIFNLVKYCSKNNTNMAELSSLIQSFTKYIKKSTTLLNDKVVEGLSDRDMEVMYEQFKQTYSASKPLIIKLRDIGNRGNSNVGKIDKGENVLKYLNDIDEKQTLKYTVNILVGLAINVRELIESSNQLMLMCQNISKAYEKSFDGILQNVDNRTAPLMKMISIVQKMIADVNKELNGEGVTTSILQVINMIDQITNLMH